MRRAIGITFKRNRRNSDHWTLRQTPFKVLVLCLTLSQAEAPPVMVNHDLRMIRVVKRRGAALERGLIEVPLRRGESPDELGKFAPVLLVASLTARGGEIKLVPPGEFGLWRQWHLVDV